MEQTLIFIGFRDFTSKKNGNHYNVLDFITEPIYSADKTQCRCDPISVFVEDDSKYNAFVKNHNLFDKVSIQFRVNGTNIRYFI